MIDHNLSEKIYKMALDCGYDNCGLLPISDINIGEFEKHLEYRKERVPESAAGYQWMKRFSTIQEVYPWAKSVFVGITWLGKTWQRKVRKNYAKSLVHLPRQGERTTKCVVKSRAELGIVRQS